MCLISPLLCLAVLCLAGAMRAYPHIRHKEIFKIQMILGQLLIITFFSLSIQILFPSSMLINVILTKRLYLSSIYYIYFFIHFEPSI